MRARSRGRETLLKLLRLLPEDENETEEIEGDWVLYWAQNGQLKLEY